MSVHRLRLNSARGARLTTLGAAFLTLVIAAAISAVDLGAQSPGLNAESREPRTRLLLDSARTMIARAVPVGDVAALHGAQALLERALTVAPNDPWLLHYFGFALYREATLKMGRDGADAGPLLERADSILERSTRLGTIPESHALRAGLLGMMIGTNPLRGMTLGPKSGEQMERAVDLGPDNPRVWMLRGIGAVNTPEMFGGGLDKAEEYLKKSIELFAKDQPKAPAPAWGLNEAHVWLGQVYAKQNNIEAARANYQKALALEPNDMWVRMSLLPALDKKKQ